MKIEVHSKTSCPFCWEAKRYLAQHEIPYIEYVHDDDSARNSMYDRFELHGNHRTVPQIFVIENDSSRHRIGGYNDLLKSDIAARFGIGRFDAEF